MIKEKLHQFVIRVPKNKANFIYYLLESHEGLLFHSTLDGDKHANHRDILMTGSITLENEIQHLIDEMRQISPIEIMEDKIIFDS
ncbi:MAG: hypothetical protein KAQ98_12950 [Bacteriovoracaceae bacterium]|nr:hypothetical protein [Bacteriovoracaceae bacterium]